MNETEFAEASHKLLNLFKTRGRSAAETELGLINEKAHGRESRIYRKLLIDRAI
jgi:hypothetical protein